MILIGTPKGKESDAEDQSDFGIKKIADEDLENLEDEEDQEIDEFDFANKDHDFYREFTTNSINEKFNTLIIEDIQKFIHRDSSK